MKTMLKKAEGINFKRAFILFFAVVLFVGVIYAIALAVGGSGGELSALWERITLARFRTQLAADPLSIFRIFRVLIVVGFNVLLALWVYADGKKLGSHKALWPALTLFTGLIGWLLYLIKRVDHTDGTTTINSQQN